MSENTYIDPRFYKPKNVIGLEDPEEQVTSGVGGGNTSGLPDGTGNGLDQNPGGGGDNKNPEEAFAAPSFSITSQELVLDSFGNYRVNAILTVNNAINGAVYEMRITN